VSRPSQIAHFGAAKRSAFQWFRHSDHKADLF
jgi:hypothetical protein